MKLSEHWLKSMRCGVLLLLGQRACTHDQENNVLHEEYIFFIFWFSGISGSFLFFDCSVSFHYVNNLTLHHWAYWWLSLWLELHRILVYAFPVYCCIIYMFKEHDNREWTLYVITNTNEGMAFSLFLLTLDNINQKRKLHANNTRDYRVPQVSIHMRVRG